LEFLQIIEDVVQEPIRKVLQPTVTVTMAIYTM